MSGKRHFEPIRSETFDLSICVSSVLPMCLQLAVPQTDSLSYGDENDDGGVQ